MGGAAEWAHVLVASRGRGRLACTGVDRKETARRFVDEAVNGGREELIDELFTSGMTEWVRDWFTGRVAQNMMLAAWSEGIGSCPKRDARP